MLCVWGFFVLNKVLFRNNILTISSDKENIFLQQSTVLKHLLLDVLKFLLLNTWFCPNGPAKKEILHVLYRHKERGWILNNYMNPSTKRILSIKVRKIEKREIFVATAEYWYLRWWDTKKNSYAFPYRETNRQQYILRKDNGIWKVYETIRPAPRTSIPHRRKY